MSKKSYSEFPVYQSRPYHSLYLSDEDEDDDDGSLTPDGPPELPEFCESDEEFLEERFRRAKIDLTRVKEDKGKGKEVEKKKRSRHTSRADRPTEDRHVTFAGTSMGRSRSATIQAKPSDAPRKKSPAKMSTEEFQKREIQYIMSATRRNLTRLSQYMLKLEARSGKTTKEGIRQVMDATNRDANPNPLGSSNFLQDTRDQMDELRLMSEGIWNRMFLVDRHWQRVSKQNRDPVTKISPDIAIMSDSNIKEWIKVEIRQNHLTAEETCFYTVQDLKENRSFLDWVTYLRKMSNFRDHPSDDLKLVQLAWRFLDRNLRTHVPPVNPTPVEQFILDLEEKKRSGVWAEVIKNTKKQEEDDAQSWLTLQKYWASRSAP
ncbi:hypothetical protein F5Y16DRAFT_354225 [Xylariaceae sp. FL0255]|nr:hypothetical protein F5Y16DRAFT_354225 [Xylariaceae sp. FL0255]